MVNRRNGGTPIYDLPFTIYSNFRYCLFTQPRSCEPGSDFGRLCSSTWTSHQLALLPLMLRTFTREPAAATPTRSLAELGPARKFRSVVVKASRPMGPVCCVCCRAQRLRM